MPHDQEIKDVIDSPATSDWLRGSLEAALRRDCVDAANDAELLSELLSRRCDAIQQAAVRLVGN